MIWAGASPDHVFAVRKFFECNSITPMHHHLSHPPPDLTCKMEWNQGGNVEIHTFSTVVVHRAHVYFYLRELHSASCPFSPLHCGLKSLPAVEYLPGAPAQFRSLLHRVKLLFSLNYWHELRSLVFAFSRENQRRSKDFFFTVNSKELRRTKK